MTDLMKSILEGAFIILLSILDVILPVFVPSQEFLTAIDGAFAFLISIIQSASWLLPLDTMIMCITIIFAFNNFTVITRIVQWLAGLIRG